MRCDEIRARFDAELDGSLAGAGRRDLQRHLRGCGACREELRRLRAALDLLRTTSRVAPAPALAQWVAEAVRREAHEAPPAAHEVFDIEELAAYLRVEVGDIHRSLDELPYFEVAGKLRFRRASIDRWIEAKERMHRVGGWRDRLRLAAV